MPVPDLNGNDRDAFYDAIPDYGRSWRGKPEPLNEGWLAELERGIEDIDTDFDALFSSKGYHFPCKRFSSATIPAEWAGAADNRR